MTSLTLAQRYETTVQTLRQDETTSGDLIGGEFYEKDGWFESLPKQTRTLICAVQGVGDHPDRPKHCSNIAAAHFAKWKEAKETDELESALALYVVALKYTRLDDPIRADRLSAAAFAYQAKWEQTGSTVDLDFTVHFFRRTVAAAEPNHRTLGAFCTNLAYILTKRWNKSKTLDHHDQNDRQEASDNFRRAIELAADHPLLPQMLSTYAEFLRCTMSVGERFKVKLLTEAVETHDHVIRILRPGLPLPYATIWRNAAIANHTLFTMTLEEALSVKAIDYYERSLSMTPQTNPSTSTWRVELAEHYTARYQTWINLDDIQIASRIYDKILEYETESFVATIGKADTLRIVSSRESDVAKSRTGLLEACRWADKSIELTDEKAISRGWAYYRTSAIYSSRYDMGGERCHLDRAVELAKLSLQYSEHPAFWEFGCWCSEICQQRHVNTGSSDDLAEAFKALKNTAGSLEEWDTKSKASCSGMLGKCYFCRYKTNGNPQDLDEALKWLNIACVEVPGNEHNLALTQNDVANVLCAKFRETFVALDLDKAVEYYALSLQNLRKARLPAGHMDFAMLQSGIGQAMLQRHLQWGSTEDLTSAINFFRNCLSTTNTSSPRFAGRACNLSYSLQLMSDLRTDLALLREAQSQLQAALASATSIDVGNSILQLIRSHLGNVYLKSFKYTDNPNDLDLAIGQYDKVLELPENDIRQRADAIANTAVALHKKAKQSKLLPDYLNCIKKFSEALKITSVNMSLSLITRLNLAGALRDVFEDCHNRQSGQVALRAFAELSAMSSARADIMLRAADAASSLEMSVNNDPIAGYEHIRRATDVLSLTVLVHSNRLEQLRIIRNNHFLPSSAAALAIRSGRTPTQVLSSLEESRAFIWHRFLLVDVPLDRLRQEHPDLAKEFELLRNITVSQTLSQPNSTFSGVLLAKDQLRLEKHTNMSGYTDLLERIREKKGFDSFMLPFSDEANVCVDGATVFLNISRYGCDAILRNPKGVRIVALPLLTMDDVTHQASQLYTAQYYLDKDLEKACAGFEAVMSWLWKTTAKPILEDLEHDDHLIPTEAGKQRIYWVASGWLSIFPIHAAGDWTSSRLEHTRPSVHERAISSYVPSLGVLDLMRRRAEALDASSTSPLALLVGMPRTPDMPGDSNLDAELEVTLLKDIVGKQIPTQSLLSPSFSDVASLLPTCQLAHFACHGYADQNDPSKSALRFKDWVDKPFNVRSLLTMKLAKCRLAFLSACQTAVNKDLLLRDEGLHVAGAFNMAGVPHTVAGMWKIADHASLELVKVFYEKLFAVEGDRRYRNTAMALHAAVNHLRLEGGLHPIYWGAFIHMGP